MSPAKRHKKKKRRLESQTRVPIPREEEHSRGVEAATVFWMLTAVATLAAEGVAGAAFLFLRWFPLNPQIPTALNALPGVLLLTALVTGTLCLAMTEVVRRLRRTPPPLSITGTAVAIGVSPWAIFLFAWALASR